MDKKLEHIAIICDGNGRWAKERGLSRSEGHKYGKKAFVEICQALAKLKIPYLTVYAFSTENWMRSDDEVQGLMKLFLTYMQECIDISSKCDFKFKVLGSREQLNPQIVNYIERLENLTQNNHGMYVQIAFNYGGRDELIRAAQKAGTLIQHFPNESFADLFKASLDTHGIPDPDIIIRTGGEKRLSNFMLWQCAYSELFFEDMYWPDFNEGVLLRIVDEYKKRNRKFGAVNE